MFFVAMTSFMHKFFLADYQLTGPPGHPLQHHFVPADSRQRTRTTALQRHISRFTRREQRAADDARGSAVQQQALNLSVSAAAATFVNPARLFRRPAARCFKFSVAPFSPSSNIAMPFSFSSATAFDFAVR